MRTYRTMQPRQVERLPVGSDWSYEVKWDGYRCVAVKEGHRVVLLSRSQTNLTRRFPTIVSDIAALPVDQCVLDGELVALDAVGRPSFSMLSDWYRGIGPPPALAYYVFDVLEINKVSVVGKSLHARRRRLRALIRCPSSIIVSEPLPGSLANIIAHIKLFGLEGLVAKRRGSPYQPTRSRDWLKMRFSPRQEFVVGGYKHSGVSNLESLLVGYYVDGRLHCAGHIREGFTKRNRESLLRMLAADGSSACPFVDLPHRTPHGPRTHPWDDRILDLTPYRFVPPRVVVECAYLGWSRHDLLRQGRYLGIRPDKAPHAVQRE